jgi:hypothetical protein
VECLGLFCIFPYLERSPLMVGPRLDGALSLWHRAHFIFCGCLAWLMGGSPHLHGIGYYLAHGSMVLLMVLTLQHMDMTIGIYFKEWLHLGDHIDGLFYGYLDGTSSFWSHMCHMEHAFHNFHGI